MSFTLDELAEEINNFDIDFDFMEESDKQRARDTASELSQKVNALDITGRQNLASRIGNADLIEFFKVI